MKQSLLRAVAHPLTYVVALGASGAAFVAVGVGLNFGIGWALVCAGVFFLASASLISKGMNVDG